MYTSAIYAGNTFTTLLRKVTNMAKAKAATKSATKSAAKKSAGYRVYRIPTTLKKAIASKRDEANVTNAELIESAVSGSLPVVVKALLDAGMSARVGVERKPARWAVTPETLDCLRVASSQVGVAASALLEACLTLTCQTTTKARKARKAGAK
jgi:hypothetical protein